MGELFRSEEMQLVQLFMSLEAARDTVDELGELGIIQFKDVRKHFDQSLNLTLPSLYYQPASFTPWRQIKWKRLIPKLYPPVTVVCPHRTIDLIGYDNCQ
jgi:hypothetical protein